MVFKHGICTTAFGGAGINTQSQKEKPMSRQILEHVRDELKACKAVTSNREFCESWLAKDESYLRVLRTHQTQPSADAFATCASKLGYYAKHMSQSKNPAYREWSSLFLQLRELCFTAMDQQAKAKWMTPKRMGL
jgi:biotin-(acetyl-CoA carboxylase) ligase